MKKLLGMIVGGALCFHLWIPAAYAANGPDIFAKYGASIDADSGTMLFDKQADEKAYPASITKVLSAILLEEHLKEDDSITASADAVKQDPSNQVFLLKEGETLTKHDALMAMMILSSNDVTYAVAETIAGSVEGFADMMNEKAKEIGATNSHFVTPNGLHHPDHYTTAHDMALIGREALKYPEVVEAMGTQSVTIHTSMRDVELNVRNKIKKENPDAIGGKTGYTNAAQNTLLEILKKDDKTVVTVVMKTTLQNEYKDIEAISQNAFKRMSVEPYLAEGDLVKKATIGDKPVGLVSTETISVPVIDQKPIPIQTDVQMDTPTSSIKAGERIATLLVSSNGKVMKEVPLVSDRDIAVKGTAAPKGKEESGGSLLPKLLLALLIPVGTYLFLNIWANIRRLKKVRRKNA